MTSGRPPGMPLTPVGANVLFSQTFLLLSQNFLSSKSNDNIFITVTYIYFSRMVVPNVIFDFQLQNPYFAELFNNKYIQYNNQSCDL